MVEEGLAESLRRFGEERCSERLMLPLSETLGRKNAHERLHGLWSRVRAAGGTLSDAVCADPERSRALSPEQVRAALAPEQGTGHAQEILDEVLARAEAAGLD